MWSSVQTSVDRLRPSFSVSWLLNNMHFFCDCFVCDAWGFCFYCDWYRLDASQVLSSLTLVVDIGTFQRWCSLSAPYADRSVPALCQPLQELRTAWKYNVTSLTLWGDLVSRPWPLLPSFLLCSSPIRGTGIFPCWGTRRFCTLESWHPTTLDDQWVYEVWQNSLLVSTLYMH